EKMATAGSAAKRGPSRGNSNDHVIEQWNRALELYKAQTKAKMLHELQSKPNLALQQRTQFFNTNFQSLQQQLAKATKDLEQKRHDLQTRTTRSVDLETRGEELKQLQQLANDMNIKLEGLDIDLGAPPQIQQV